MSATPNPEVWRARRELMAIAIEIETPRTMSYGNGMSSHPISTTLDVEKVIETYNRLEPIMFKKGTSRAEAAPEPST